MIPLFLSCNKQQLSKHLDKVIIAKVGNSNITVDEFKMSFEMGFSPLKAGGDPRTVYLNYMINELLLSLEGTHLGFDKHPYVQKRVKQRFYSNQLEAFYLSNIHGRVNVSENDIQNAIQKSTVKWRMLIWPIPTLDLAENVYNQAQQKSLVDYVNDILKKNEFKVQTIKDYETDWIDYLEIHPKYLSSISDLNIGAVSTPIPYGDGYALFQILDIHREGILDNELQYGSKRKRILARLHNIQTDSISHTILDSILTPMNIRLKGTVLEDFTDALFQWFKDGLPSRGDIISHVEIISDTSKPYLIKINQLLNKKLISSTQWDKTVRDYLGYMNYYRRELKNNNQSIETFRIVLITEIGRMIKNDTYVDIAERDSLGEHDKIYTDIKHWKKKWIYDIYRHNVVKDLDVTLSEMESYFKNRWKELDLADVDTTRFYKYKEDVYNALLYEKHQQEVDDQLGKLRKKYPVWVNTDILDTLSLPDSYKDTQTSLFVRKNFSGEASVPTVDLQWITF
ncbi:MAG: peptidyl-prolyl cis-trans isomerase [Candidatus Marinimicrobia bacterium]|nr:peptidyl-prolyl cis-trans isomerase [Candidatus Neomarinimicrobiota bacterium]MBT3501148.1 peptidyl-prolyl cis-trans isomerase [Candidatus Neomarinimicrobiota bacterium]MBT3840448.1 peptidyl-prolyl cis-trans isomerase [Candidatus Neomarinimicrobiota bacterium]MBT4000014.1 peptidyl-prolyl cis-trans isomerase [Candidatus Neomarinimicrobiota bacterium]MBT4282385.1 peptidyl-prolyl cis-trans isomerase [Candidatus Neomarinimicrobiota bacterium]